MPPICAVIRAARESSGLTQQQIGEAMGVTQQRVQQWEKNVEPKLDVVAKLERAIDPYRRRGWLLRAAGYVEDAETLEDLIDSDPRLDRRARAMLHLALRPIDGG